MRFGMILDRIFYSVETGNRSSSISAFDILAFENKEGRAREEGIRDFFRVFNEARKDCL